MPPRKHSKKRDAILECIRSTTAHPTAEWIYTRLKPEIPNLSLGTVYRNLAAFKAEGQITSVGVVDGLERFDFNTAPHAHFICLKCKAVIDLAGVEPPAELAQRVDCGIVRDCTLTFTGICKHCVDTDAAIKF